MNATCTRQGCASGIHNRDARASAQGCPHRVRVAWLAQRLQLVAVLEMVGEPAARQEIRVPGGPDAVRQLQDQLHDHHAVLGWFARLRLGGQIAATIWARERDPTTRR